MKALTLTQPWASLVAAGAKKIETRSWGTSYRGPLAIHAAKGFPANARAFAMTLHKEGFVEKWESLPIGAIVATCWLRAVIRIESQDLGFGLVYSEGEKRFGDFTSGRYAWLLHEVERLDHVVPARGSLGLWEWKSNGGTP